MRDQDAEIARLSADIHYSSVATVALGFRRKDVAHPLNGSGYVVPRAESSGIRHLEEFSRRLRFLLNRIKDLPTVRFAVEIRNKSWLDERFTDLLREYNVALALTDTSFIARPWEMKEKFDLVTSDFLYVRWLGDRHGIEKITQVWDKTVVDRKSDLKNWAGLLKQMVNNKDIRKLFGFFNNHYAGHGPATVKMFWDLWEKK